MLESNEEAEFLQAFFNRRETLFPAKVYPTAIHQNVPILL